MNNVELKPSAIVSTITDKRISGKQYSEINVIILAPRSKIKSKQHKKILNVTQRTGKINLSRKFFFSLVRTFYAASNLLCVINICIRPLFDINSHRVLFNTIQIILLLCDFSSSSSAFPHSYI